MLTEVTLEKNDSHSLAKLWAAHRHNINREFNNMINMKKHL